MAVLLSSTNASSEAMKNIMLERLKQVAITNESVTERLQNLVNSKKNSSKTDLSTIFGVINGDYNITLKQYTNLSAYDSVMSTVYGNNSANLFQNTLNKLLKKDNEDGVAAAKSFLDKMKENGFTNQQSIKLYSALQKYSIVDSYMNEKNSFVSAKI